MTFKTVVGSWNQKVWEPLAQDHLVKSNIKRTEVGFFQMNFLAKNN